MIKYPLPKSEWGPGPWQDEKDELIWRDIPTGYMCRIFRNIHTGALCGYVCVPTSNKSYNRHYDAFSDVIVHGGLTFGGRFKGKRGWWFGFDCGHGGDLAPGLMATLKVMGHPGISSTYGMGDVYRSFFYVWQQCGSLANQLSKFER